MSHDEWQQAVGVGIAPGDVIGDKYRVERLIGAGGMGAVLEAYHLQLEERVALKVLRPELVSIPQAKARFEREARAAFKIRSEHVVRVIDVSVLPSGSPFMVLEYLDGHDLSSELAARGCLPVTDAVEYVLQAAEAIAEGHRHGIVHRDLKPDNVVLRDGRDPVLIDLGLARFGGGQDSLSGFGTPPYAAPEQWEAELDQRHAGREDIYALGVIIGELVGDEPPEEKPAGAFAAFRQRLTRKSSLPPKVARLVQAMLVKDPAQRTVDLHDVAGALEEAAAEAATTRQ